MVQHNDYPTTLVDEVQELPGVPQAALNARGLYIVQGLTEDLARQLGERSQEPHVVTMCFNDYIKPSGKRGRFFDVEAVVAWQVQGRLSLPLVKEVGRGALELHGFGWMGPGVPGKDEPEVPGALVTFATRLYRPALGQGNAKPYVKGILTAHAQRYGNNGVWLEAWGDNVKALSAYTANGFREVARVKDTRPDGKEYDRVYMTLDDAA